MDPDLNGFSPEQQLALLDLLILTMYADGHLTQIEDARVEKLLVALGYTEAYDRQRQVDAAVTRVRQFSGTPPLACGHAEKLAQLFTTHQQRRQVYGLLQEIVTSDFHITAGESQLLESIRLQFRL